MDDYSLILYSEWLDCQGLIRSPEESGDSRTHDDLVSDYLRMR